MILHTPPKRDEARVEQVLLVVHQGRLLEDGVLFSLFRGCWCLCLMPVVMYAMAGMV